MKTLINKEKPVESYLYASDKERIVSLVMKMGKMAGDSLSRAMEAIITADDALAQKVENDDDGIDALNEEGDLECLRSIAMRQPVRDELRFIFATLKTMTDLERIGDEAVNIARWVRELRKYSRFPISQNLVDMADIAGSMLRDVLEAFKTSNGDKCSEIRRRDSLLDRHYAGVINDFLALMTSWINDPAESAEERVLNAERLHAATGQMWISRHLERVGDHVSNMAGRVYFMDKGKLLEKGKDNDKHREEPITGWTRG
ncbi:phosphate transport system regulatory protein PhoU [Synergistales bacterium]|nr:phosphate transport system regulatory protein PhoU [Synergistales bacterium]